MEEKKKYRLLVVCVREGCNGNKKIIKKGIHAEGGFMDDKEALEKFWHIVQKDLVDFFDRISCYVLQDNLRVGIFRFPEKKA